MPDRPSGEMLTRTFLLILFTGHRSLSRDLEAQVALVTENEELREALHEVQLTR